MEAKYDILADYLSDHLWQRNALDYDFLKTFPEFFYQGLGYRALFSDAMPTLRSFKNQSFAKTIEGVKEYILNARTYDKDFVLDKEVYVYECHIEGFDVSKALSFFKKSGGLTTGTIDGFHQEDEVIAFSHTHPTPIFVEGTKPL